MGSQEPLFVRQPAAPGLAHEQPLSEANAAVRPVMDAFHDGAAAGESVPASGGDWSTKVAPLVVARGGADDPLGQGSPTSSTRGKSVTACGRAEVGVWLPWVSSFTRRPR